MHFITNEQIEGHDSLVGIASSYWLDDGGGLEFLVHAVAVVLTSVLVVSRCVTPPFLFHFICFIFTSSFLIYV
jgi:hypothetical protein